MLAVGWSGSLHDRMRGWDRRAVFSAVLIAFAVAITSTAAQTVAQGSARLGVRAPVVSARVLPHSGLDGVVLQGVSCVVSTFCVAVGSGDSAGGSGASPVVERWNG